MYKVGVGEGMHIVRDNGECSQLEIIEICNLCFAVDAEITVADRLGARLPGVAYGIYREKLSGFSTAGGFFRNFLPIFLPKFGQKCVNLHKYSVRALRLLP